MRMSGRRLTASKKNTPPASGHQRRPAGSIQRSHRRRPQGGRNIAYTPPRGAMSSSVSQSLMRATDSHRRRQGTSPDSASKLHGLKPITSNRPLRAQDARRFAQDGVRFGGRFQRVVENQQIERVRFERQFPPIGAQVAAVLSDK